MNAALQCMLHTPQLVAYVASNPETALRNASAPCSNELFKLIKESITNASSYGVSKPSDLKYRMGKEYRQFAGVEQQDSIEFLHELLELTNKELNRAKSKAAYKALSQTDEPIGTQVSFQYLTRNRLEQHMVRLRAESYKQHNHRYISRPDLQCSQM